ncbi:hypothetical protein HK096_008455, partial [Nowakowskiella sp. JEL0078]
MSLSFLFGNVGESGRIDDENMDSDFLQTLNNSDTSNYLASIVGVGSLFDPGSSSSSGKDAIQPREDAVDFSNIDDDDEFITGPYVPEEENSTIPSLKSMSSNSSATQPKTQNSTSQTRANCIKAYLSDLDLKKPLKFSELFAPKVIKLQKPRKLGKPPDHPNFYEIGYDDSQIQLPIKRVHNHHNINLPNVGSKTEKSIKKAKLIDNEVDSKLDFRSLLRDEILNEKRYAVEIDSWEDRIIWDDDCDYISSDKTNLEDLFITRNHEFERDTWITDIIWDDAVQENLVLNKGPFSVNMLKESVMDKSKKQSNQKFSLDKFNLSNDEYYEIAKTQKAGKQKQTQGPTVLMHSIPALNLIGEYFKPQLSLKELRSFHRPIIELPFGLPIRFSKVKTKKKIKGKKDVTDFMKFPLDLTVKDTSKFALFEYSEEYPPIMSNVGMASLIMNYYRKKDEKDTFTPQMEFGVPETLEPNESSPFKLFGD